MVGYIPSLMRSLISFCFLQTPVLITDEKTTLDSFKELMIQMLGSNAFVLALMGIAGMAGLVALYNRSRSMPELEAQVIKEDTWFVNRDDNKRIAIVISVRLRNRSTKGIYIRNCKLSGYSPKKYPSEINLDGLDNNEKHKISFPSYKHFGKGDELYIGPYNDESVWFYYESRSMTMSNLIETFLHIKDSRKKRRSLRVQIPRHSVQLAIYQKMSEIF